MALNQADLKQLFGKLSPSSQKFIAPATLEQLLNSKMAGLSNTQTKFELKEKELILFITASIEIWQRALNSFIYSVGTNESSKNWS